MVCTEIHRASPASSESLPSNTPSSEFPLEKVMSYLTDDMDDSVRPIRAYSVGSRSDTSAIKNRLGKNRLEAVQENFRTRAMSVGSKNPRKTGMNLGATAAAIGMSPNGSRNAVNTPLSNSWSGSTGRWLPKFPPNPSHLPSQNYSPSYNHTQTTSESADSDLMELDFSKNKTRNRKRSLTNMGNFIATPSSSSSSHVTKLSPIPKGVLANSLSEVSPNSETSESPKLPISVSNSPNVEGPSSTRNYVASAPISIQRGSQSQISGVGGGGGGGFMYPESSATSAAGPQSLSTMLKGNNDLKQLNEIEDEASYLDMDFTPNQKLKSDKPTSSSNSLSSIRFVPTSVTSYKSDPTPPKAPVVVTPKLAPYPGTKFSLFSSSSSLSSLTSPVKTGLSQTHETSTPLTRSLSSSSNISTTSNNSNSSSASCASIKSQSLIGETNPPTSLTKNLGISEAAANSLSVLSSLTRIEESPEKQDNSKASSSGSITPQSPLRHTPVGGGSNSILNRIDDEDQSVTYAAIEHVPTVCRNGTGYSGGVTSSSSCGSTSINPAIRMGSVTYAQIDFVKNSEPIKPNN
jgi:hypothetical protein